MNRTHLITALVFIAVGYLVGIFFPAPGQKVIGTVSSAVS